MLMKAKKKNVYKKFLCELVNPEPSPTIDNGKPAYVLQHIDIRWQIQEFQNRRARSQRGRIIWILTIVCGGFGSGHIPSGALKEFIRITKLGGVVVIVMREEYLKMPEYSDSLEPLMKQFQNEGFWMCIERSVVQKYFGL
uniref:Uncharacterized protein LOC111132612 n=1 Tax=Crassostrea virginica TaxID=6565 RepID=A0A8B8E9H7_CRAVI|nr:uncharacterized protein LOC111132612 [Crassostrea virginica]